jgi:hypothetical protein
MDKKIISLWLNGYSIIYIVEKLNTTQSLVESVINQKIFYEEGQYE